MFYFELLFLSFSFSGVCLYDIAELLVPCFKNEEKELETTKRRRVE